MSFLMNQACTRSAITSINAAACSWWSGSSANRVAFDGTTRRIMSTAFASLPFMSFGFTGVLAGVATTVPQSSLLRRNMVSRTFARISAVVASALPSGTGLTTQKTNMLFYKAFGLGVAACASILFLGTVIWLRFFAPSETDRKMAGVIKGGGRLKIEFPPEVLKRPKD